MLGCGFIPLLAESCFSGFRKSIKAHMPEQVIRDLTTLLLKLRMIRAASSLVGSIAVLSGLVVWASGKRVSAAVLALCGLTLVVVAVRNPYSQLFIRVDMESSEHFTLVGKIRAIGWAKRVKAIIRLTLALGILLTAYALVLPFVFSPDRLTEVNGQRSVLTFERCGQTPRPACFQIIGDSRAFSLFGEARPITSSVEVIISEGFRVEA